MQFTIYVERSGGSWEAMYYTEFGRSYHRSHDKQEAVKKALRHSGYKTAKVVSQ